MPEIWANMVVINVTVLMSQYNFFYIDIYHNMAKYLLFRGNLYFVSYLYMRHANTPEICPFNLSLAAHCKYTHTHTHTQTHTRTHTHTHTHTHITN